MTEPVDPPGVPFVGLRPFDTSDSKWFSGRGREAAALTKKIRNFRFTAVVGPSGSGKSSIVRAGVIPLLEGEGWRYVVTTPGSAPLAGLAMALSGVASSDQLVEARRYRFDAMLRESTFGLAEIAETLRSDAPRLLLVVDQFEELFRYGDESSGVERAAMREEARAFIELLLSAASREGGNMYVCITMRSDYFGNCSAYVGLAEALSASQFLVPLPLRSQMEEAIRRPVSRAGGAIEEALVQRLLVDVAEEVDQLPLLQHTLRRLWEKASGSPRTMHEGDYVAVGKIAGSIDKKAEEILAALTAANPVDGETVERVMKALTGLDERDRATRRSQKLSELRALVTDPSSTDPGTAEASLTRVLDALKAEDTSFLRCSVGDDPEIDIGHEALIRSWKRLAGPKLDFSEGWLREERNDGDEWRAYVRRVAEGPLSWRRQGKLSRWLSERSVGEVWSRRYGNRWFEVAELRVRSSRSTRLKMATALAAAAASIFILGGLAYLWENNKEAALRLTLQQQAKEKRIVSLGRSYFESEGPVPAILITNKVLEKGLPPGPEAERVVLRSLRQLREKTALMKGHLLPLVSVDFSPGGQVIVTADANNLFFWKSDDGSKLSSIDLSKLNSIDLRQFGPISGVQWSPRGDQIAVASRDRTRLLFPCSINELKEILAGDCVGKGETQSFIIGDDKKKAGKAKFTTDEQWLVTGSPGEYPKRWNLDHKIGEVSAPDREYEAQMASPSANGFAISEGDKSVDKSVIAVGDTSGKIQVFDFASGAKRLTLETPSGEVNGNVLGLAFNPRHPAMLAAAFQDGNVLVWKDWHGDSQHPIKLRGTNGIAYQIGFTNDGGLLMATSDDGTPLVWEIESLGDPHPWELRGHFGPVYTAAFSSDGNSLVTGSTDKTAIVWNKRPVLDKGSPDPQEAPSPNGAATNAASGCGTEIILTKEFTKAGCVETPLHHVFILSPQGKVMEFDKRDTLTPVDQYQGAKDADGLKLEPGYLVITSKSGDTHWRYFDDFDQLMEYALKNLPQIGGKPLSLKREILCQIDENC